MADYIPTDDAKEEEEDSKNPNTDDTAINMPVAIEGDDVEEEDSEGNPKTDSAKPAEGDDSKAKDEQPKAEESSGSSNVPAVIEEGAPEDDFGAPMDIAEPDPEQEPVAPIAPDETGGAVEAGESAKVVETPAVLPEQPASPSPQAEQKESEKPEVQRDTVIQEPSAQTPAQTNGEDAAAPEQGSTMAEMLDPDATPPTPAPVGGAAPESGSTMAEMLDPDAAPSTPAPVGGAAPEQGSTMAEMLDPDAAPSTPAPVGGAAPESGSTMAEMLDPDAAPSTPAPVGGAAPEQGSTMAEMLDPDAAPSTPAPVGGAAPEQGSTMAEMLDPDATPPTPAPVGGAAPESGSTMAEMLDPDAAPSTPAPVGGAAPEQGSTMAEMLDPDAAPSTPAPVGGAAPEQGSTMAEMLDPDAAPSTPAPVGGAAPEQGSTMAEMLDPDAAPSTPAPVGGAAPESGSTMAEMLDPDAAPSTPAPVGGAAPEQGSTMAEMLDPDAAPSTPAPVGGAAPESGSTMAEMLDPDAAPSTPAPVGGAAPEQGSTMAEMLDPDAAPSTPAPVGGAAPEQGSTMAEMLDPDATPPTPAPVGGAAPESGSTMAEMLDPDAAPSTPAPVGGAAPEQGSTMAEMLDPDAAPSTPAPVGGAAPEQGSTMAEMLDPDNQPPAPTPMGISDSQSPTLTNEPIDADFRVLDGDNTPSSPSDPKEGQDASVFDLLDPDAAPVEADGAASPAIQSPESAQDSTVFNLLDPNAPTVADTQPQAASIVPAQQPQSDLPASAESEAAQPVESMPEAASAPSYEPQASQSSTIGETPASDVTTPPSSEPHVSDDGSSVSQKDEPIEADFREINDAAPVASDTMPETPPPESIVVSPQSPQVEQGSMMAEERPTDAALANTSQSPAPYAPPVPTQSESVGSVDQISRVASIPYTVQQDQTMAEMLYPSNTPQYTAAAPAPQRTQQQEVAPVQEQQPPSMEEILYPPDPQEKAQHPSVYTEQTPAEYAAPTMQEILIPEPESQGPVEGAGTIFDLLDPAAQDAQQHAETPQTVEGTGTIFDLLDPAAQDAQTIEGTGTIFDLLDPAAQDAQTIEGTGTIFDLLDPAAQDAQYGSVEAEAQADALPQNLSIRELFHPSEPVAPGVPPPAEQPPQFNVSAAIATLPGDKAAALTAISQTGHVTVTPAGLVLNDLPGLAESVVRDPVIRVHVEALLGVYAVRQLENMHAQMPATRRLEAAKLVEVDAVTGSPTAVRSPEEMRDAVQKNPEIRKDFEQVIGRVGAHSISTLPQDDFEEWLMDAPPEVQEAVVQGEDPAKAVKDYNTARANQLHQGNNGPGVGLLPQFAPDRIDGDKDGVVAEQPPERGFIYPPVPADDPYMSYESWMRDAPSEVQQAVMSGQDPAEAVRHYNESRKPRLYKGSKGSGVGYLQHVAPHKADGDNDGVVAERPPEPGHRHPPPPRPMRSGLAPAIPTPVISDPANEGVRYSGQDTRRRNGRRAIGRTRTKTPRLG